MEIRIYGKDIELTPEIKAYTKEKVSMLEKYYQNIQNVDVELSRILSGQHKGEVFRAEWNVAVPGKLLRVEKTEESLYKAIDKVKDHLVSELVKYKEIIIEKQQGKI